MPVRHPVTPELVDHLTAIRKRATATHAEALAAGPDPAADILGAIAWRLAWPELPGGDPVVADLIDRARARRFTWREIAVASGESDDRGGEGRTRARQVWRRERHPA